MRGCEKVSVREGDGERVSGECIRVWGVGRERESGMGGSKECGLV